MRKDLFEELGIKAEEVLLREDEILSVEGGSGGIDPGLRNTSKLCFLNGNNIIRCIDNTCDPDNVGGCEGNTSGGGAGTCPLSN